MLFLNLVLLTAAAASPLADWGGCDPPFRAPYSPAGAGGSFHMDQFSNLWWANHVMAVMTEAVQNRRPWSLYRFGGLGQQRYPVGFAGDAFQHFLTLQWEVETVASAANVAFPYWSYDIGGYMCADDSNCDANTTSLTGSELLLRWYQFGVRCLFFAASPPLSGKPTHPTPHPFTNPGPSGLLSHFSHALSPV